MPNYFIELRTGEVLPITDQQAQVVDQAWTKRAPVKLDDIRINTVDIVGLWPDQIWYELHPEARPPAQESAYPKLAAPKRQLSEQGKLWLDAIRRNQSQFQTTGVYGSWEAVDGQLAETAVYAPRFRSEVNTRKVTKQFSPREFNRLAKLPGYRVVDEDLGELEFLVGE